MPGQWDTSAHLGCGSEGPACVFQRCVPWTDRALRSFPQGAALKVRVVVPDDAPAQGYLATLGGFSHFRAGQSVDDPHLLTAADWTGSTCHRFGTLYADVRRRRQMVPPNAAGTVTPHSAGQ